MKIINDSNRNIYIGNSFKYDLFEIMKKANFIGKKILLITGERSFVESFNYIILKEVLSNLEIEITRNVKVKPNPKKNDIDKVIKIQQEFDTVIAIGGGSVVDFSKMVVLKRKINNFLVIYTLPGSASLVTPFAIFDKNEFKVGHVDENMIPSLVYINTNIIDGLDGDMKIISMCDIFAHSIESLVSSSSTKNSRKHAIKSLNILSKNKDLFKIKPIDLLIADIEAGMSERIGLVLFPHAAGHYLTYKFGVTHAIANMVYMGSYLKFLSNGGVKIDARYINLFNKLKNELIKRNLISIINLDKKEINEMISLINKYMPFAYLSAPLNISIEDYVSIVNNE